MKLVKAAVFVSALIAASLALTGFASAQIVALGASNVAGYGVSSTEASARSTGKHAEGQRLQRPRSQCRNFR